MRHPGPDLATGPLPSTPQRGTQSCRTGARRGLSRFAPRHLLRRTLRRRETRQRMTASPASSRACVRRWRLHTSVEPLWSRCTRPGARRSGPGMRRPGGLARWLQAVACRRAGASPPAMAARRTIWRDPPALGANTPLYGSETLLPPSANDGRGAAGRVESARDLQKSRRVSKDLRCGRPPRLRANEPVWEHGSLHGDVGRARTRARARRRSQHKVGRSRRRAKRR